MEWVKTFYSKQNEWFGIYLGSVNESHHKRAWLIQDFAGLNKRSAILELGAGGGQTAIALANLGHLVSMVELLPESVKNAKNLAAQNNLTEAVKIIQGDFYEVDFDEKFDVICYFDSFGIGSDMDQVLLLERISAWLTSEGIAIIEVGSTWFWSKINNTELDLGAAIRRYDFDFIGSRLIDSWYLPENPEEKYAQSLRCYTPADFELLLQNTDLFIEDLMPGGTIDLEIMEFVEKAELPDAMTYYVKLKKKSAQSKKI